MRTVLVTGGSGFIGGYVVEELLRRGYEVTILDTRDRYVTGAHTTLGDMRDPVTVAEAVAHSDGVIHLAGLLGTAEMVANPQPAVAVNIGGAVNVFDAVAKHDVPLVNMAIGNHWMDNTYSITKDTADRFARMYVAYRGARISTVRTFDAYGPRQVPPAPFGPSRVRKIVPSFACRALAGDPIEVYGDGEQVIDLIWVGDVASILVDALEATSRTAPLPLIEAGTGQPVTVNQVAELVLNAAGPYTPAYGGITHLPMRPGETPGAVIVADPSTQDVLGPRTLRSFDVGVWPTVEYYASLV